MKKTIPKVKGQGIQGLGVSIAAVVTLTLILPIATAYIVEFALFFSDDDIPNVAPDRISTSGGMFNNPNRDIDHMIYEESGEGPNATYSMSNYSTNSAFSPGHITRSSVNVGNSIFGGFGGSSDYSNAANNYHKGKYRLILPGCNGAVSGNTIDCGDSGYILQSNITHQATQNFMTYSRLLFEFQKDSTQPFNEFQFGENILDYVITFNVWEYDANTPAQTFNTNGAVGNYFIDDSVRMTGTNLFSNCDYGEFEEEDFCHPTITVDHVPDFVEFNALTTLLKNFQNNPVNKSIWVKLEINNLRTEDGKAWDMTTRVNPFKGGALDKIYANYDFETNEIDPVNTALRLGITGLGIFLWAVAIASTPFWDPVSSRIMKKGGA